MKQLVMFLVAAVVLAGSSFAQMGKQDSTKESPTMKWQGYLVDAKSAPEIVKDSGMAMMNAAAYTKESALKDESRGSGYGIVSEGKWLKFDAAGDKQVAAFLKTTKQKKGLMVTVSGKLVGGILSVSSIKESVPVTLPEVR